MSHEYVNNPSNIQRDLDVEKTDQRYQRLAEQVGVVAGGIGIAAGHARLTIADRVRKIQEQVAMLAKELGL